MTVTSCQNFIYNDPCFSGGFRGNNEISIGLLNKIKKVHKELLTKQSRLHPERRFQYFYFIGLLESFLKNRSVFELESEIKKLKLQYEENSILNPDLSFIKEFENISPGESNAVEKIVEHISSLEWDTPLLSETSKRDAIEFLEKNGVALKHSSYFIQCFPEAIKRAVEKDWRAGEYVFQRKNSCKIVREIEKYYPYPLEALARNAIDTDRRVARFAEIWRHNGHKEICCLRNYDEHSRKVILEEHLKGKKISIHKIPVEYLDADIFEFTIREVKDPLIYELLSTAVFRIDAKTRRLFKYNDRIISAYIGIKKSFSIQRNFIPHQVFADIKIKELIFSQVKQFPFYVYNIDHRAVEFYELITLAIVQNYRVLKVLIDKYSSIDKPEKEWDRPEFHAEVIRWLLNKERLLQFLNKNQLSLEIISSPHEEVIPIMQRIPCNYPHYRELLLIALKRNFELFFIMKGIDHSRISYSILCERLKKDYDVVFDEIMLNTDIDVIDVTLEQILKIEDIPYKEERFSKFLELISEDDQLIFTEVAYKILENINTFIPKATKGKYFEQLLKYVSPNCKADFELEINSILNFIPIKNPQSMHQSEEY